jgi:hypothetical protein
MPETRLVRVVSLKSRTESRPADLAADYTRWRTGGMRTPVTARLLAGQFYFLYKQRFSLFPIAHVKEDVGNLRTLLTNHLEDDPSLAPYVLDYFFSIKDFQNFGTRSLTNANILRGWHAIERAVKLRSKGVSRGEQAEFTATTKHGSIRI